MKIRAGFVSNSSSSSYTCDISGCTESGWDLRLCDAGMWQCRGGHTMSEEYVEGNLHRIAEAGVQSCLDALPGDDEREHFKEQLEDLGGDASTETLYDLLVETMKEFVGRYELSESLCPICQMEYIKYDDVLRYLLNRMRRTYKELCVEIKHEFEGEPLKFYEDIKGISLGVE